MSLTRLTALEIFTNPNDLHFSMPTAGVGADEMFGISITRGPGHNFKPMLSGSPTRSRVDIIQLVTNILNTTRKECNQFIDAASGLDPDRCLTEDQQRQILESLQKTGEAATYNMFVTTA